MSDVLKEIVVPYFPRNIVNPIRAKYIDSNIIPLSLFNVSDDTHIYNVLYNNSVLRNKILAFHNRIIRTSNISPEARLKRAHAVPWTSNMKTKCITCNEEVDLLNYSVLAISKYRIIIEISKKIDLVVKYEFYKKTHNCCPPGIT